ncbi:Sua5/YciO/YrdC/YwlC family protein [Victivallaceae bacterium BBE-744-WT-12]|uniref:L-threonylcarbamoyladenylate synthase n=1 Tax=Victivallis lenta TaxID=2606640 RepID=A0A844FZ06_9BACT|nr:L-threonylcarbamoyladenylate synthase [Victivallis lenta]MST95539.1 Sua5/YciO/YrdC/YwlC family protein [Victivallis lenta]
MTRVLKLAESGVDAAADAVLEALAGPGAVVLLPTETVYGLVCRADDAAARQRIYDLKDRDASKPLGWFVADWRMLAGYGVRLEGLPEQLAVRHCPGPITIIAPRQDGGTTGFRVPDHPLVLAVLRRIGCPLAQTSANHSGHPNALTVQAALAELSGDAALAVDGGPIAPDALASTVVDATGKEPRVLRRGALRI